MNKSVLQYALECVFFNQYNPDITRKLNELCCLFSYYRKDDANSDFSIIYNKLQVLLTKIQLLKNANQYPSIPTDFRCNFDFPGTSRARHTFAPVIKMPKYQPLPDYDKQIESIIQEMTEIDIASLVEYVHQKAVKAGDLAFEKTR